MEDKCPNCGETLITRTIQKKLGLGSIDFPVAQICQKCNWSRDLTGAGDIVAKPPAPEEAGAKKEKKPEVVRQVPEKPKYVPEKKAPDMNKIITIALALLVIAGIIWAFMPKVPEQSGGIQPTPTSTPIVTASATVAATATPEVTRTGNNITVKLDRDRGFFVPVQSNLKIKQGDGVVWINDGVYSFTIVSNDGLFEDKVLDNDKRTTYIFKKSGTYTFDIIVNGVKKFSGTVVVEP